jgi:hypothetical protein
MWTRLDAHSYITCVHLYAVMATNFVDACVIHSRRIHGDMAGLGVLPSDSWQLLEARGRSGSLAAWQRGTLPGCLPGCPVHGPPMLCHMPSKSTAAVDLISPFGLGCRTETPSVASCRRRLHFISFVEVSFFEGAWEKCGRPRKTSQAKSMHICW